jgi:hypothetical protein
MMTTLTTINLILVSNHFGLKLKCNRLHHLVGLFCSELKEKKGEIIKKLQKQKERLVRQRERFVQELKNPKIVQRMDKFAFTFGVVIIVATALIVGRAPTFLPTWYMIVTLSVSCSNNESNN